MNKQCEIETEENRIRPEKSEVKRLFGSNEKLLKLSNWKQKYDFESGLRNTIEWFMEKNNLDKYKCDIYNI
jgi:dTDP-glucose 4,6-dehydratase